MDAIRPASKESNRQGSRPSSRVSAQTGSRSGSKAGEADKRTPSRSGASSRISASKELLEKNTPTPVEEPEKEEAAKGGDSGSDRGSSGTTSPVDPAPAAVAVAEDDEDLNEDLDDIAADVEQKLKDGGGSARKDKPPLEKSVSFDNKDSNQNVTVLKTWDGREIVMVSVECQTDRSSSEVFIQPTLSRHPSISQRDDVSMGSASPTEDEGLPEDTDTLLDDTRDSQKVSLVKPESRETPASRGRGDGTMSSTTVIDRRSSSDMTPFMPYNDEFGIPLLDISSDSDDSLDFDAEPREKRLIAGIGPPQILQYIRESQMEELESEDPTERLRAEMSEHPELFDEDGRPLGMFGGKCEFCAQNIKPFPTLEQQQKHAPESLFCCDQYREFVQFATTTAMEMEEEAKKSNRLINVKVHGHFGSKQERKAAKEKAVQRETFTRHHTQGASGPKGRDNITSGLEGRTNANITSGLEGRSDAITPGLQGRSNANITSGLQGRSNANITSGLEGRPNANITSGLQGRSNANITSGLQGRSNANITPGLERRNNANITSGLEGRPNANITSGLQGRSNANITSGLERRNNANITSGLQGRSNANITSGLEGRSNANITPGLERRNNANITSGLEGRSNANITSGQNELRVNEHRFPVDLPVSETSVHSRMRERELQRRQQEAMGLTTGASHSTLGGGGGGGAQGGQSSVSGGPAMARAPSMKTGLGMQQSGGLSFKDMAHAGHGGYQASSHGGGFEASRQMKTINYQLSSQKCLDEGWTLRAPSPIEPDGTDMFTPDPLNPDISPALLSERPLIEKYYEDGRKFLTIFPNGTGTVFYPSGNVAITISSVRLGHFTYVVQEDDQLFPHVRASFCADGSGFCYYSNGNVRLSYDQLGGIELDTQGGKKRRWKWWEVEPHIHAPPFQPICFSLNQTLGVRIMTHNYMTLTFLSKQRSCRFHVGTRMQVSKSKLQAPPTPNEHQLFLKKKKSHVESVLAKISTLLRYPRSPKIDGILPPIRLSKDKLGTQRTTSVAGKSDRSRSKASSTVPVVTVN